MESNIGLAERWELIAALPIEGAAIDQDASDDDPVTAKKFGRRVHDQPPQAQWAGTGKVSQRSHRSATANNAHEPVLTALEYPAPPARVAQHFTKDQLGIWLNRIGEARMSRGSTKVVEIPKRDKVYSSKL